MFCIFWAQGVALLEGVGGSVGVCVTVLELPGSQSSASSLWMKM
ncbi:hypothetical protein T11_4895 [Trichinella zimbabwensis]|uniref:Uncharacterized protein n=1 Tax=Trichinella zimbabwensis TaxID=268475 RepID=A0A0V1G998_9BILA|nr:hypothetical protein T11_4895 [Trichinella zimbabwensis]